MPRLERLRRWVAGHWQWRQSLGTQAQLLRCVDGLFERASERLSSCSAGSQASLRPCGHDRRLEVCSEMIRDGVLKIECKTRMPL